MWRFVILIICVLAGPAMAERAEIPGEKSAAFAEARDVWLDGDDQTALNSLKDLAGEGNTAAQILLARIAEEPHMHRHVTGGMMREDRISLLRQFGGLSGTSWLQAAMSSSDLATALVLRNVAFSSVDGDKGVTSPEAMAAVKVLLDYGEVQLATEVAFKLIDGVFMRETLALLDAYGAELDPINRVLRAGVLMALSASSDNPDDMQAEAARTLAGISPEEELALGRIYPWEIEEDEALRNLIIRYAELVPAWKPMRDLCETSCAATYDTCLLAGGTAIGYSRRFPFASPLQSFIPDDTYWQSARIRGDAARRMIEIAPAFEEAAKLDQCFAQTVAGLAQ